MYPLDVKLAAPAIGFAIANDEAEHQALSDMGYLPAYVESEPLDKAALIEQLKAAGVAVDARWSVKRLQDEVAKL